MGFLAGFLAEWNAIDDRNERRREFEREMAYRAQSLIWPQVFEEMTKVNEVKAARAEKFAQAKMAGLSEEATLVLQAQGELDPLLARVDALGDKYNSQWARDFSALIGDAVDNETELGVAVKALVESAEKDGTDVPADLTWARIQAALMETASPEEAFDMAERLSKTIGDWKSEVARIPRFAVDVEVPGYTEGALQLMDSEERQRIRNQVEDSLGAVGEGKWIVGENGRRKWAATDDAGYQRLLNTLTQEVIEDTQSGVGDVTTAIQSATTKVTETRAENPDLSPTQFYQSLYDPNFQSEHGAAATEEPAAVEPTTVEPINTQQGPNVGEQAADAAASLADNVITGDGVDGLGQPFSSGDPQEDKDRNKPSSWR